MTATQQIERIRHPQEHDVEVMADHLRPLISQWRDRNRLTVADYGCSTTGNGQRLVRRACSGLVDSGTPPEILFFHIDQSGNGVERPVELTRELLTHAVVAGSFYDRVLPEGSVDLAISSCAVHWLSHESADELDRIVKAANLSGWLVAPEQDPIVNRAASAEASRDLVRFLRHRAAEMTTDGLLVLNIVGRTSDDHQLHGPFRLLADSLSQLDPNPSPGCPLVLPFYRRTLEEVEMALGTVADKFAIEVMRPRHGSSFPYGKQTRLEHAATYCEFLMAFATGFLHSNVFLRTWFSEDRLAREAIRLLTENPDRYRLRRTQIDIVLKRRA